MFNMTTKKKMPYLQIIAQPPIEQRTRTAKEKRLFKTSVRIHIPKQQRSKMSEQLQVTVSLLYADSTTANRLPKATSSSSVNGLLLGGTTSKKVFLNTPQLKSKCGKIPTSVDLTFDDLNLNEPSSRHKDREFCILFTLKDGVAILDEKETTPCYAYSHPKVLKRRRDIYLKALSTVVIDHHHTNNENKMHAVGGPFIQSPRLGVLFQFVSYNKEGQIIDQVELYAQNLELFSESVLFFDAPRYPEQINGRDVTICVSITNDSRHFSNSKPLTYVNYNIGILPIVNNQTSIARNADEKGESKQLHDSDVDVFLNSDIFSNNDVQGGNPMHVTQLQRRRKSEDWVYTMRNEEDDEKVDGVEWDDEKTEFGKDEFSLPLSFNGHAHNTSNVNNYNTSSPSSWEDNEASAALLSEELDLSFALFESISDMAHLKPKRKRMRSRM
jgi:hypothetical protein